MNKVGNDLLDKLRKIVGEESIYTADGIGADFGHDEEPQGKAVMPEVVCEATSTEAVSSILRACSQAGVAVTTRGAGTGLVGGCVPVEGGVVLSMSRMSKILGCDAETMTMRAEPGASLTDIKAAAEASGFYYPPDPGEKTATIGGNAATNAGGPSAVKYGVTRDYISGATVVLPSGEIIALGGAIGKNSTGYNLLQLLIGSEGTLGVITELILKLEPKPKANVTLILPYP